MPSKSSKTKKLKACGSLCSVKIMMESGSLDIPCRSRVSKVLHESQGNIGNSTTDQQMVLTTVNSDSHFLVM